MTVRFQEILDRIKYLPEEPGCYLMKDKKGKIFYVGKAINLRNRVRSYFSGGDTRTFVSWLENILSDLETIVVRNETEALLLEISLIRQHRPRFNVQLKDDKNYILLRLDTRPRKPSAAKHLRYPRLEIVRKAKNDGARYFGPYPSAAQLRMTLHLINKLFKLRTCNDHVIDNRARPCIQYQIGRCGGPCVQEIPDYFDEVQNVVQFLQGNSAEIEQRLKRRMWQASAEQHFEAAGRLRDQYNALKTSLASQAVTNVQKRLNQDVIAAARQEPYLEIVHIVVRGGKVLGNKNYSFAHQEFPTDELLSGFLGQLYENAEADALPDEILLTKALPDAEFLAIALSAQKQKRVVVKKPLRGKAKALTEIAQKNADVALRDRLQLRETQDASLVALQKTLGLANIPRVIECFDVSLFQGTDAVASKVRFVEGAPDKSGYRKFNIKTVVGTDDFAMLYESITRRLKRGLEENDLPDLLLVDGGKGQLSVALAACKDLGIEVAPDKMFVAGIAKARVDKKDIDPSAPVTKSSERLFVPGVKDPILLREHTAERYLVERIRNEAHRFAITAHRARRKKRTLASVIESIPGIGPARRKALLKHFGSLQNIREATPEHIAQTIAIKLELAEQISKLLKGDE